MIILLDYSELTDFDFKILDHVYNAQNRTASLPSIYSLFKDNQSTKLRIDQLVTGIRDTNGFYYKENTQYLCFDYEHYEDEIGVTHAKRLNTVYITPLGIKALEEYKNTQHKQSVQKAEDRFWKACPILIALFALFVSAVSFLQSIGIVHAEQWPIVQLLLKATIST